MKKGHSRRISSLKGFIPQLSLSSSVDIGDRVFKASNIVSSSSKNEPTETTNSQHSHLWKVALVLFLSLIAINGLVYVVIEYVISEGGQQDRNLETKFSDDVRETVPFVQKWYRSLELENNDLLSPTIATEDMVAATTRSNFAASNTTCLERWFDDMQEAVPYTSPAFVELILENMGLSEQPLVRNSLRELLTVPQILFPKYVASLGCLSSNEAVERLACVMEEKSPWDLATKADEKNVLEYAVNTAVVYESLTLALMDDAAALHEVIVVMSNSRHDYVEKLVKDLYSGTKKEEFILAKYRAVTIALQALGKAVAENTPVKAKALLQVNILEAVKLDASLGQDANARVGMALAADVQFDIFVEGNRIMWRLGKDWVDSYIAWNLAFISGSLPLNKIQKLLIPSVSCTVNSNSAEDFMGRRIVSLALSLMTYYQPPSNETSIGAQALADISTYFSEQRSTDLAALRHSTASALGESNLNSVVLASPSNDMVEQMLSELCDGNCDDGSWQVTDTTPQSRLDDTQFQVYVGFIVWVTVLLAGLGLELLVWLFFLQDGWSKKREVRWKLAQFAFPLFAATTLGLALQQNFLALPFLVSGLWKFGFPETLLYMYLALHDFTSSRMERISDLFNAIGTVVHHGAASMLICVLLAGVLRPDRHIIGPILILLMQHWFVLVRYVDNILYLVVELALDAWFQWAVISNFQYYLHWTASLSAANMLVAHWLFITAAALDLTQHNNYLSQEEHLVTHRNEIVDTNDRTTEVSSFEGSSFEGSSFEGSEGSENVEEAVSVPFASPANFAFQCPFP